jgi:hypothetical protein
MNTLGIAFRNSPLLPVMLRAMQQPLFYICPGAVIEQDFMPK